MIFESTTIERLAKWEPVENIPIEEMDALLRKLPATHGSALFIHQLEWSQTGMSNYDAFFVSDNELGYGNLSGVGIFVSSLTPFVAIGPMSFSRSPNASSWSGIEPTELIDSESCNDPIARTIFLLLAKTRYRALTRQDALTTLPEGVIPYEYCYVNEPWDRLFHLLFSNTD
jgi:hypothetical protein